MKTRTLQLLKNHDRRLRAGHLWVYSNEVDTAQTPLKDLEPGDTVAVVNAQGRWMGWAWVNPNSLICGRIVGRDKAFEPGPSLMVHRIKVALALRERLYARPYYRLLFGESDGLPGAVVDRYGDWLVVQLTTAAMEVRREELVGALEKVLKPKGILLRNDSGIRDLEGLDRYVEVALGEVPEMLRVEEAGCQFEVDPHGGQKTGWFYDQAENRSLLTRHVQGSRVLDVCSYVGAWGVRAAAAGAARVDCMDVSARALDGVERNAELNDVSERVGTIQADAFDGLKALKAAGERYDVIVLDPPAFIKRKKDMKEGVLAYRRLNEAALSLLSKDGILATASCSFHMDRDGLLRAVQQAARHVDRNLQLLQQGHQGPDHPVHPAIMETAYLKAFYLRVLPTM